MTLAAVASAFAILSVEIRRQTRSHLADLLAQNQKTVLELQRRNGNELLWTSRLMTQSPTLRAAMETYRSEIDQRTDRRSDLLATVQTELDRTRALLGKQMALIADVQGEVLAASLERAPSRGGGTVSSAFAGGVRGACPADATNVSGPALLRLGEELFQVSCVPIVLQDFVIGTLTLGDRLDTRFLQRLKTALQSDALIVVGRQVRESTLMTPDWAAVPPKALLAIPRQGSTSPVLLRVGSEEYVATALPLGSDGEGEAATLVLLQSLTRAAASATRSLLLALTICGAFALLLAGLAAWGVSRSILRPFERFVAFMHSVAEANDHSRRFDESEGSAEVRILNQAYNHLMDSLQEREKQLVLHAREELVRVERLKESEKLASLGRMLSGAAHEINNPLTGVVGYVDMLLRSPEIQGSPRERLEKVQRESQRMIGLVRNLLRVAHKDTGKRAPADLHSLLKETAALRRHDFATAGLELRLELPAGSLVVDANELELQQVFLNLLNNAYDALKEKARDPVLTIRTGREGDQALVVFEDGGPGLADSKKVFDPFYTTKEVGKGTGLGLSISHTIVQNHGGHVTAENRDEGGARFTVRLPIAAVKAVRRENSTPTPLTPLAPSSLSATVLVVEDEPSILELQLAILCSLGASAVGARTGREAIECVQRRDFDLIVSDLKMPGEVSGQDFFRWVELNRPTSARKFIFVTGDTASEDTQAFLTKSSRSCLKKPFSVDDYVALLRETLAALKPAA